MTANAYLEHFSTLTNDDIERYRLEAERLADKVKKTEDNGARAIAEAQTDTAAWAKSSTYSLIVRLVELKDNYVRVFGETDTMYKDIAEQLNKEGAKTRNGCSFTADDVAELLE